MFIRKPRVFQWRERKIIVKERGDVWKKEHEIDLKVTGPPLNW